ncbi:hypothetical protein C0J52_08084 [Blattella germanica]|nr:hypothetical protein C0J52_08084 [Blattella germanica]
MWLCKKLCSATIILSLLASFAIISSENFLVTAQFYQSDGAGNSNYDVQSYTNSESYRTSKYSEARFMNFGGFARIGGYIAKFYRYFESGMNLFFGDGMDEKWEARSKKVRYNRYQLLRVIPRTTAQVDDVLALRDEVDGLMYWTQPAKNHSADILVPPDLVSDVKEFLQFRGLEFVVLLKDIQKAIASQNPRMTKEQRLELRNARGHEMTFKRYHRYSEMLTIGKSTLGQPLKVIKVSTGQRTKKGEPKPAVWIDGGMHAREWISPAVVLYTLKQLVENFRVNRKIVEGADWYILPLANPDGYEYSHTTDRLWRKTRSNHEERDGSRFFWGDTCRGVDLNRNWDFHWGEVGASDDPCHETYAGPRAFSEPETRAISDFIMDRKDRIKLYLTMHAYSQMWLLPWGYTNKKAGDHEELMNMGRKAVDALNRVSGTQYKLGPATSLLYPTSGGADDWAKGAAGIKYAYTVELRDDGTYGFLLPASQIVPTGKETFAAIKAIAKAIVCKT